MADIIIEFNNGNPKTFKEKVKEKWETFKVKASKIKDMTIAWANENPEQAGQVLVGLGGLCITGGGAIYHQAAKKAKKKKEHDESEKEQYDPRTGQYFYIRRPMTNAEKLQLSRRMQNGEYKAEILNDLGLL